MTKYNLMKPLHGGNLRKLALKAGCSEQEIIDFSSNINPLGPPAWLRTVVNSKLSLITSYPDPSCTRLREIVGTHCGVSPEHIVVGNGGSELLYHIPRALQLSRAVVVSPAYVDYRFACEKADYSVEIFTTKSSDNFFPNLSDLSSLLSPKTLVIIGSPSTPIGAMIPRKTLLSFIQTHPECMFVIDEAFIDFAGLENSIVSELPSNAIVVRSLTKFYAIPGLRIGYAVAKPPMAQKVFESLPSWSVNTFAQEIGSRLLRDELYDEQTKSLVTRERAYVVRRLEALKELKVFPSVANYLLVQINSSDFSAFQLAAELLKDKIAIRVCDNYDGLDQQYFRIAVKDRPENDILIRSIYKVFGKTQTAKATKKKPALMLQGTASSVGKSLLTTAFCRILLQDGYRVAPFKAQNMSNNSWVNLSGEEIARSQVVQAQAAKLEPDSRMNPILLKPLNNRQSQIIFRGKAAGSFDYLDYRDSHNEYYKKVCDSYDSLAQDFDVVVLEGAGSSAEVNLKAHDLVNMKMAKHADASVLIIGDIDRGGVFASFVGMMTTFSDWEQELVSGFLVNRFRGNPSLLTDAFTYMEENVGKPVLGVIPMLSELKLPEEDGVQFSENTFDDQSPIGHRVDVALIGLQRVSNYNDIDPLRFETDVRLRIVRKVEELGQPDIIIIPGSRNVFEEMTMLEESGLKSAIQALVSQQKSELVGICGGLQLLGKTIHDPYGIESIGTSIQGLNLLDLSTKLEKEKNLSRDTATHIDSSLLVEGYRIHHGTTIECQCETAISSKDGERIGYKDSTGLVWGTYLHGVFDNDLFRRWFIDKARARKGLSKLNTPAFSYTMEAEFDRLATAVRSSVDLDRIYQQMGLR